MGNLNSAVIRVRKLHLPSTAPSDYTDGAFCLKLNGEWLSYMLGATGMLRVRAAWKTTTEDEWSTLDSWLAEINTLITVCSEEETPAAKTPKVIYVHSQSQEVGRLGLTLEELEDMLMCLDISEAIQWNDTLKKFEVWSCHEGWVDVKGWKGETVQTSGSGNAAATLKLDDWLGAGSPPLPEVPSVPHVNSAYTTVDSVRCAKASALANLLWDTFAILKPALVISAGASEPTAAFVVAELIAAGLTGGWAVAVGIALAVIAAMNTYSLSEMASDIDEWDDDDELKASYICHLAGALYPGEKIVDEDIKQVRQYFLQEIEEDIDFWLHDILGAFPAFYWKDLAQPDVADTDCGCQDLLPAGVNPFPPGDFRLSFTSLADAVGSDVNSFETLSGRNLTTAKTPPYGALSGGRWKTSNTAFYADGNRSALGVIFESDGATPLTLTSVRIAIDASLMGGNDSDVKVMCWDGATWNNFGANWNSIHNGAGQSHAFTGLVAGVLAIVIMAIGRTDTAGVWPVIKLNDVIVSGSYVGGAIADLPVNTLLSEL